MKPTAVTTRRRFFWKAGAALSAPLAVATAEASERTAEETEALKARLGVLEDANAIRDLNRAFAKHVNARAYEELGALFADSSALTDLDKRIRSVSSDRFEEHDIIEISADRRTATSRIHCTAEIEAPIEPRCPLVDMALQQGGGVTKRSERGVFENAYVKQDGVWKISRSAYVPAETLDRA